MSNITFQACICYKINICNFCISCTIEKITINKTPLQAVGASQMVLVVKNPPANPGDIRDVGSIPGSGRLPGERNGSPPYDSCIGNLMDRGAWWATVHGIAKEWDTT